MFKTLCHVTNGPAVMYEIDARHALANVPEEWKETEEQIYDIRESGTERRQATDRKKPI